MCCFTTTTIDQGQCQTWICYVCVCLNHNRQKKICCTKCVFIPSMDELLLKTVIDGQNGNHKGIILDGIQIHMVNIYSPYLFFVFVSFFFTLFYFHWHYFTVSDAQLLKRVPLLHIRQLLRLRLYAYIIILYCTIKRNILAYYLLRYIRYWHCVCAE